MTDPYQPSGLTCDRCGGEVPPLEDDPQYRVGFTVQIGEFSLRVDDQDGDSYDEPDNDQRWYCRECWSLIKRRLLAAYAETTKPKAKVQG